MIDLSFGRRVVQWANDNIRDNFSIDRTVSEFQSDAAAIEEAPVPLAAHAALYALLALLVTRSCGR
jgi:hypothetical protein